MQVSRPAARPRRWCPNTQPAALRRRRAGLSARPLGSGTGRQSARELMCERDPAMLFVTYDLAMVRQVLDRGMVMYLDKIIETGRSNRSSVRKQTKNLPWEGTD
jgi:hypothetical protein